MGKPIEACHIAVGARIRLLREALGLSQDELATRTKYTRGTLANIETGRHRFLLHVVEEYARALGTTPKHLLRGIWF